MKFWTAHTRPETTPVLVREGFAWGALFFGPLWLAAHRAWIPAILTLVAGVLILLLAPAGTAAVLMAALAVLVGLSGNDLRRWSMGRRGYLLTQVIVAADETEALRRLLDRRPDIGRTFMPASAAR